MTVINAMKFNKEQGAIISDEQSSFGGRKEDAARKLATLFDQNGTMVITGGSGYSSFNKESTDLLIENIKPNHNFKDVLNYFSQIFYDVNNNALISELQKKYGDLSIQEVLAGKLNNGKEINPKILDTYFQDLTNLKQDFGRGCFLILGKDKNKNIELYGVEALKNIPMKSSSNYGSIGSGSDISSLELSKFSSEFTREQRDNIDAVEGLIAMLYATHLSTKVNAGVGGIPEIAMINKDKIIRPDENSCQLSKEIATAGFKGLLRKEYVSEAIGSLILKNEGFNIVEPTMWKEAKDNNSYDKLNLFLRGYKV